MKKYGKAVVNIIVTILGLLLAVFLIPWLLAFFAPFVIGWIISWLAAPPVNFFEKRLKIKRKAGSAVVIIAVIALITFAIYGIGAILVKEGKGFVQSAPEVWASLQEDFEEIGERLDKFYLSLPKNVQEKLDDVAIQVQSFAGDSLGKLGTPTLTALGNFAKYLPTLIVAVIVCLLSAYFFVADRENVNTWCRRNMPKVIQERYWLVRQSMIKAVGGYVKAQFKIEIWVYLLLVIGLWILQVKYVLLIAVLIAFLDFLPIFGTGTVMVPWAVIKFLGNDYKMGIGLLIVWGMGQLVRQIIQPKIVGDSVGLSPLPTLILLYVGFQLGGVPGMIIAIPIGLIFYSFYEGGVFENFFQSIKLLVAGINHFRRFTPEDLETIQKEELEEEKIIEEKLSEISEESKN